MLLDGGPLRRWNESRLFAVKIDPGDFAERQLVCVLRDLVHTEPRADVVEEDIARHFGGGGDADVAMAILVEAREPWAEEDGPATAIERSTGADSSVWQARHSHELFE